jgi:hypothetical protein
LRINIYLKFLFGTEALNDKASVEADPQVKRIEALMAEVASLPRIILLSIGGF